MAASNIIFFGNELPKGDMRATFRGLHNRSKDASHPLLARFIVETTRALREEVSSLTWEAKQHVPPFDTAFAWAEMPLLREGPLNGAVEGALLIMSQIGAYIGYVEDHPGSLQDFETTSIAGLGVGLLSSTVAALSAQPSDLPLAGADVVALAFRMGVHVQEVSANLVACDPSAGPETWAIVVHNVDPATAQMELDAVQASERVPETSKIFLSAISPTAITISGPPMRLKATLLKLPLFSEAKTIPLPVYGGLCHASHIYSRSDVTSILAAGDRTLNTVIRNMRPIMQVYSTSTGEPYPARSAIELLESVLSELLTQSISWHVVVAAIDHLSAASASVLLNYFGNSLPFNELKVALQRKRPDGTVKTNDLCNWSGDASPTHFTPRGPAQDKLAIVGMSCRLPGGATSTEKFWEILEKGLDVSRQIPADRFDIETHYDPTGKQLNKTTTQYGCFIDDPGLFDAPFFNLSPREAQVTDPQMRLSLVTAYEALERAGYVGNRTFSTKLERIGTYYGQAADDYREVNQGQEVSTHYIPGGCRAFGPGRINYFFKFAGPSYSIDTACSSGLAAIEVACQALWAGDIDTAVAGGVNVLTNPDGFAGLCNGHFLTKGHNACKTWDASADGYCRADAVGTVVIKRLEDAQADNDNILAVVLGAGTNHSATAVSITHPHAGHQAYLARSVLGKAGVDPLDVSYVELHGTGTQAGDSHEMAGILDVYAPSKARRKENQPLHIGAVKANVGHSESAAGTTALLKVLLMMQKNAIPRHIGIVSSINPKFPDLAKLNVHIPFSMTDWPRTQGKQRKVAINNFGAAGGNTTMILEDAPDRPMAAQDPRRTHIVSITAKNKISLKGNIERLIEYLNDHKDVEMADLSYSTTARRYQHTHRIAITTSDIVHLTKQLGSALEQCDSVKPVRKSGQPTVAFTFTGQGAALNSGNLELYRDVPVFRKQIQHLDKLAQLQGFPSFIAALDGSHPKDHSHAPTVTQLALVCTEIALAAYWASLGVTPDVVVGHSLGEYAAMCVAGVITASDTISMVGRRAQMLEENCSIGSHSMVAVRASLQQINETLQGRSFTVACINGPADTVLSGTKQEMDEVTIPLEAAGYRCIKLDVAFAFHSAQMDPILEDFEAITKSGIPFHEPQVPYISPLLGKVVFDSKTLNANYVRRATRETVNYLSGIVDAEKLGTIDHDTIWVEIGPHPVGIGFVKSTLPSTRVTVPSMRRGQDNWTTTAESMAALHLAGVDVNWNEFHRPFERRLRLLDLPTYAFNEKNHWLQYNGAWCLTKGNTFYDQVMDGSQSDMKVLPAHEIQTSTVQHVVEEKFNGSSGTVAMVSDLMQPEFLAAAHGHRMNNCGVVTSSIHADIAYTLGAYLYRKMRPHGTNRDMNIGNLVVTKGLVVGEDTSIAQRIQVTATTPDIYSDVVHLTWQNVDTQNKLSDPFATANIIYGQAGSWLDSWAPIAHLIHNRILDLDSLALQGKASRFSSKMAYALFAGHLVDYADKYRGMQSVTMHGLEAYADVRLTTSGSGKWVVPPYFIDSVAHLAGFVMNCSDSMDTKNNFCVTPGWDSMKFAESLTAGGSYRSYVKMIPNKADPTVYSGNVYIMRGDGDHEIIGMVGGILFRKYPRVLLGRFFSPPKATAEEGHTSGQVPRVADPKHARQRADAETTERLPARRMSSAPLPINMPQSRPGPIKSNASPVAPVQTTPAKTESTPPLEHSTSAKALQLVANEAGIPSQDLNDDDSFADLGVDSLMSLVITEKLRTDLGVQVGGSLFLDYPTIGAMRVWLDESYA